MVLCAVVYDRPIHANLVRERCHSLMKSRRQLPLVLALVVACGDRSHTRSGDSVRVMTSAGNVAAITDSNAYPVIRGVYLNRFAAQNPVKMRHLLAVADSTEI